MYSEAAGSRNEYMRQYMADRYHSKRKSLIEELGGACKSCGSKDKLHIDHVNAKDKTFRAADIHSVSDEKIQKEKKNFQLLCEPCHKKKTHDEWDYSTPKSTHGTYWQFRRHGCRCEPCVQAYKETMKEWRLKAKEKKNNLED